RTRRRTTHPRLAPPTPPPAARLTRLDKPPPPPRRPRPTHTPETTQILLHPIRRPTAKRALASRLHPLAAGQRHHHRNPVLARRLLTAGALSHRTPPRHRHHRRQRIHQSHCCTWHPILNTDRQRHGVHHPIRR